MRDDGGVFLGASAVVLSGIADPKQLQVGKACRWPLIWASRVSHWQATVPILLEIYVELGWGLMDR